MNIKLSSLNKGLVGHWTMSQDSLKGSLLADKTPYSNDGTIYGATFATDRKGQANKAMSFDGVDDYIDLNKTYQTELGASQKSITAWAKSNKTIYGGTYGRIFTAHRAVGFSHIFFAASQTNKWTLFWTTNGSPTFEYMDSGISVDLNWHFFSVVINNASIKFYIDNLLIGERNNYGVPVFSSPSNALIGSFYESGNYKQLFNGQIDDVRIYNRALSEPEIKTLYNSYNPNIKMKTSLPKIKLYGGDKDIKADGFIRVDKNINNSIYFDNPESNLYGKQYFYVMQYQARDNGGVPQSTGAGLPWTISQIDAKAKALLLGEKYHLMTNWEWMAIARDIEQVAENWTGGAVGSGMLKRGNIGITDAGSYKIGNPETGILNDKAILKLSNGEEIYHFSGNVWEWMDDKIECGVYSCPNTLMPYDSTPATEWVEFTDISTWGKYSRAELGPLGNYNSTNGVGKIYTDNGSAKGPSDTYTHALARGGRWSNGANAGVFALNLEYGPTNPNANIGFRCAR